MADNIRDQVLKMDELSLEIEHLLNLLKIGQSSDILAISERISKYRRALLEFHSSLRAIAEPHIRLKYYGRFKYYEGKIGPFENQVKTITKVDGKGATIEKISDIKEETLASLDRTKAIVSHTIEIGSSVSKNLEKQGEIIRDMAPTIEKTRTTAKKATKVIRNLIQTLKRDWILLLLVLAILTALLLIFLVHLAKT